MDASKRRFRSAMDLGGLTLKEALQRTWTKLNEDELMTRAAAITFYAIASLVPFLGLVVLIAAEVLPWISRDKQVDPTTLLEGIFPAEATKLLVGELDSVRSRPSGGLISFGTIALLWLNSSLFVSVMDAVNRIMRVTERRPYWKQRLIALFMAVLEAILLILVLASTLLWPQILGFLRLEGASAYLLTAAHGVTVFGLILISFAAAMYFAPDADQRWEWITPGSLLGALLLVLVSYLFRFYVQRWGDYSATYGSLAGVIVLMSWIWLCAVELLVAAEFNKVIEDASPYGKDYGERTESPSTRARAAGFIGAFFRRGPLKEKPNRMRLPMLDHPSADRRPEPDASATANADDAAPGS